MARNLKPWLRDALAKILNHPNPVFPANLKSVGRVQVFRFVAGPSNLSCEISDGEHFIAAAFTEKAVSSFEKNHDRLLPEATGAVVHIKECSLRLHLPHPQSSEVQSFCPAPDSHMCPRHVCSLNRPQFWFLISTFAYIGGDGNSVFGEPLNVNLRDAVSFKLERLAASAAATTTTPTSAKRMAAESPLPVGGSEEQARKKQKSSLADAAPPRSNAPQTSKRTLPRAIALPALGDVPFIDDMKSVWECESLWSTLAIQHASIPFMPIHGLPKSRPRPNTPRPPHICPPVSFPVPLPPIQNENENKSEDTLNGLLVPAASRATPAFAMMDAFYGDSYVFDKDRMDTDEGEEENEFGSFSQDASAVIARSLYWDQPAHFAFTPSQFNY
ncbi:hypothetical protein GGI20_000822 [Coemansia sp. BCRC 34301]|nr:hypothetical protein GGI20_000822 [Coemansia sp. BCRC 34301]